MSSDEKAAPRLTRGRQEVDSHRRLATIDRPMQRRVSVDAHQVAQRAIRAADVAVTLAEGKTADQIAAEVAARAKATLRGKPQTEAVPAGAIT